MYMTSVPSSVLIILFRSKPFYIFLFTKFMITPSRVEINVFVRLFLKFVGGSYDLNMLRFTELMLGIIVDLLLVTKLAAAVTRTSK
jgi:hypothetical protein